MLADDKAHQVGRKATVAAFSSNVVKEHGEMIREVTQQAMAQWPHDAAVPLHHCFVL